MKNKTKTIQTLAIPIQISASCEKDEVNIVRTTIVEKEETSVVEVEEKPKSNLDVERG